MHSYNPKDNVIFFVLDEKQIIQNFSLAYTFELSQITSFSVLAFVRVRRQFIINYKQAKMIDKKYSKIKAERFHSPPLLTSISTKLIRAQHETTEHLLQKKQVTIPNNYLQAELKCYDWRIKTQLPIIKVYDYKTMKKDSFKTILSIRYQNYPIRLRQLKQLPLFKVLYLLKESIIGLERLFDRFGSFVVTSNMVALSQQNKCKIWFNQNFASNQYMSTHMEEKQFLQILYKLFLEISNTLKNTIHFFRQLSQSITFCQALVFIQNYARQNKISIPNSCRINQRQLSIDNTSNSLFNPSLTMTKSPKFLNNYKSNRRNSRKSSEKMQCSGIGSQTSIKQFKEAKKCKDAQNLKMKTSGDTAVDIYGSNTLSQQNNGDKKQFDQSIIFGEIHKQNFKIPETPLKFSKIGKKLLGITRHFSQNLNVDTYFTQNCKYQIKIKAPVSNYQSLRKIQLQQVQSGKEQVFTPSIAEIFQKNNWEKTLNCLFVQGQDMKISSQHGVENIKTLNSSKRLFLLQKVSKDLHESYINNEEVYHLTNQF